VVVPQPFRVGTRLRQQQQPAVLINVTAENHETRGLFPSLSVSVKILHARSTTIGVDKYFQHPAVRAQVQLAHLLGTRYRRHEGARLRVVPAPEPVGAEAAVPTGRAFVVDLAGYRRGLREQMQTKLLHRFVHHRRKPSRPQRRHRIVPGPRRLERVRSTLTGHVKLILNLVAVRLEVFVGHRPIHDVRALGQRLLTVFRDRRGPNREIVLQEPRIRRSVVGTRAAHAVGHADCGGWLRRLAGLRPPRRYLTVELRAAQAVADGERRPGPRRAF
jgi:hypothetical protein